MPNPADDLRDGACVTQQAFCQALCYGHVSPWEPAALSKRPARPDQGTGAGPENKEHPKHLAQSLSSTTLPLFGFFFMLYISLIHVLEPMSSSQRCASPLLPEYPLFLRIKSWSTVPIEQLSWLRRHAMYERQCSSHRERKITNKSVLRSVQL